LNGGVVAIGNEGISSASVVEAGSLTNSFDGASGTIDIVGSSTWQALLKVDAAAGFGTAGVLDGLVELGGGQAEIEFASGQITTIAAGSTLVLAGPDARVADASKPDSNSALTGLTTVAGALDPLDGASVTTSGPLLNTGVILLDSPEGHGGSSFTVGGALTNNGTIDIGGDDILVSPSTVSALDIINGGVIGLSGDGTSASSGAVRATVAFTNDSAVDLNRDVEKLGAAISGTGQFELANHSTLEFGSSVSSGQTIAFDGAAANTLTLTDASTFKGAIDHFFVKGDTVDVTNFAESATNLVFARTGSDSASWTLTDGVNRAVLNFVGEPYVKNDFEIVSANGAAGTGIKFI
jgi:hypothetical protein